MGLVDKAREDSLILALALIVVALSLALAGERHAQNDSLLASAHLAALGLPSGVSRNRPRPQSPHMALHQREHLIANRVPIKRAVSLQNHSGLGDRLFQKVAPFRRIGLCGIFALHIGSY